MMDIDSIFFRHVPADLEIPEDAPRRRLLREYGAVFVARGGVTPPDKIVFEDEADTARFQSSTSISGSEIGGHFLELQSAAMEALLAAIDDAGSEGLSITPRGADSARRNYGNTIELWRSRVEPALDHWIAKRRIALEQAEHIRSLSPSAQVPEILALEEEGVYFAKDLSKSIIYSVAPPGASQHLSLLAFDVAEFDDERVREILAKYYWYQTVTSDLPHFTFLGVPKDRLVEMGLKEVIHAEREFWVPDI